MPHYFTRCYIKFFKDFGVQCGFGFLAMHLKNWPSWCFLLVLTTLKTEAADDDYNILHRDGSFEFGYDNPNSYHHAAGNRNNVVRGEFGGRNPGTGRIDSTQYTAGPRGYRPRGKNVHRKFDLNQNGPRPVGSRDDPYFDPYEDPSYSFEFKTRTYNRQENANRVGDVNGRYNFIDDVGEIHNVEYIAGKNIGFHVKTPYPDSNPRAYYGRLYYRGRGKPIPRGRTSIQRGLDGSYRFVSAGPDQRRTETSDSSGHVRGSYTYLDDKGVQHSVHYIAGPETGYRVLKNVKGPHLPTIYPFGRPEIIPPDFYDYIKDDVFDTAASGPINNIGGGGSRPNKEEQPQKPGEEDKGPSVENNDDSFGAPSGASERPSSGGDLRPPVGGTRPPRPPPGGDFDDGDGGDDDFEGELFGPSAGGSKPKPSRPTKPSRPFGGSSGGGGVTRPPFGDTSGGGGVTGPPFGAGGSTRPPFQAGGAVRPPRPDDGSYKPDFGDTGDDGSYIPPGDVNQDDGSYKPGLDESEAPRPGLGRPPGGDSYDYDDTNGLFGSESNSRPPLGGGGRPPVIQIQGGGNGGPCERCQGTIVTNVGDKLFSVPPGVSVPSPSEQYNEEMSIKTEQLNSAASDVVSSNSTVTESSKLTTTVTVPTTTTSAGTEATTINE
ncbi:uncharacterized protein Cpr73D isoform X2 [Tribolium castaneum]|uniref:uncharacterized protein Cpr73D isoform X2 n=1 Tax=Tribolium castaneum TaxID=7070 RepID=UPI00077DB9CA|nr:PREDICTED: uncharacterized protein LOC658466 isoform X2 [Tribolium castaneum]|eukprot:XP_015835190.1 PREDICTED: uncharacterized protein LOC658466 isoform X2 [Tribolium castaneum]